MTNGAPMTHARTDVWTHAEYALPDDGDRPEPGPQPAAIRPGRLQRLRSVCLALPEAVEKPAHGDPAWRVRDRIFAAQKGNHAGGRPSLWLKSTLAEQDALLRADTDLWFVPPYVGHRGWIGMFLDGARLDWAEVAARIEDSYRLVAPKTLVRRLDAG
jgi:predicted DNA-binding protein (MmcQ/YjbR family)